MKADQNKHLIRDYGVAVGAAIVVALLIRLFVIEAYRIPSSAMKPTLSPGDLIFVAKWPFGVRLPRIGTLIEGRAPERGEVVIFSLPSEPSKDYIKRVVAISGDTVEIRQGQVRVNGKSLSQSNRKEDLCGDETTYSPEASTASHEYGVCWEPPLADDFGPEKIPDGSVFVLGDLRSQPLNRKPRSWGTIPIDSIKAKALWTWLSIEPAALGAPTSVFNRIQFERMFRRIK